MNDVIPPKQPTPKVDAIQRALRIFTLEQLEMFLDECEKMREFGYGAVAMEFDHHHPNKVIPSQYKMLPK